MAELKYWYGYTIIGGPGHDLLVLRQRLWPHHLPTRFHPRTREFSRLVGGDRIRIDPSELDPAWVAEAIAYSITRGGGT